MKLTSGDGPRAGAPPTGRAVPNANSSAACTTGRRGPQTRISRPSHGVMKNGRVNSTIATK
jgi:hypothetical protein